MKTIPFLALSAAALLAAGCVSTGSNSSDLPNNANTVNTPSNVSTAPSAGGTPSTSAENNPGIGTGARSR
jgi:hypothetical protein